MQFRILCVSSKFGGSFASRQAPRHSKGGGLLVMNLDQQAGHMDFRSCAAEMEGERWKVAQCIQVPQRLERQ